MNSWDSRYRDRLQLLVEMLPVLDREPRDFAAVFDAQFRGMATVPLSVDELLAARSSLLQRVGQLMDAQSRAFLLSVEREAPDFDLIGLPHAAGLPGVRRKLQNLAQRSPGKRAADFRQLEETLGRIGANTPG